MAWVLAAGAAVGIAVFLFAWSGIYSVAASRGHWAAVDWFLTFGMRNSVELRAMTIPVPPLDNPDLVRLGAAHFHSGCAFCHGAPGTPVSPISRQMLPPPPDLTKPARPWKDEELFWIVQNGIKYTGMPGWVALERDDEIWAVVAFLKRIASMDENRYRELALGVAQAGGQTGERLATVESNPQSAGACARCHGAESSMPRSTLVPILHGQPVEFLTAALRQYASGERRSGIMQPLASDLDAGEIERLAAYYARLSPRTERQPAQDSELTERGRRLATEGDAASAIPACDTCHGGTAFARYPRLAGQNAAYMANRLRLWQRGQNAATEDGAIMAPIAKRLRDRDIDAVTTFLSQRSPVPVGASRP